MKAVVGQHHFMRSFLPALTAVLLVSSIALLGFGIFVDRHLEKLARGMAQRISPGSQVALELDLALGRFALETVTAARIGDERGIDEAESRLSAAALAYDGWAHAANVTVFTDMTPVVATFEERVAAANPRADEVDTVSIEDALDDIVGDLRVNRSLAAAGATHMLEQMATYQRHRRVEESTLLALLVSGCVALLFVARRQEERVCADEVKAVAGLEQVNADLEAFAGRVAHDLRNPLVPILSGSQVIERSDVDARVRKAAERIERSARRLAGMIDMLLDFSRVQSPNVKEVCDVAPIVDDIIDRFSEKARTHGITLVSSCEPMRAACEPIVVASPLQNLIENAFKYGTRADIEPVIEVRGFLRGGMVMLEVEDRGPGIDAPDAENLFRAFRRGSATGDGVGLGLAMARRLVEARGGSVGLRAGRFGGALFQIRLPSAELHDREGDVTAPLVPA
jgi:signal transduction histidine kinase